MTGSIAHICVSETKGVAKAQVERAQLRVEHGIEGDAHAGDWHRQVSLLALDAIESMRAKGLDIGPGAFAENLGLIGIDLDQLGLGSRLEVGEAELRISQIGKVCHTRCQIFHQAGDCIMPRQGLFARVIRGGALKRGDAAEVLERVDRATLQAVVLTISDRCSRGQAEDTAGPAVAALLREELAAHVYQQEVLPDERDAIAGRLQHYSVGHNIDLLLAVGGTGFAPRDVTPEAVRQVVERLTPGLDEAMRRASLEKTPHAMLSRAVSGIAGQTLIISLPGSERGALENLQALLPALPHGLKKLRGDPEDCGRPSA